MAIDKRYQDNIILKKDAFQNLLTNIKNYPIVDIDYVTESDIDELHGDKIWPNYTNGMPCIKITYGDDRSTKGNIIFKEDWRKYLNKANKEIARLNSILNEYERRRARWIKIYNQNKALEAEKLKWIQTLGNHQELLSEVKQDFLLLGLNFLYNWGHPQYEDYYLAYTENNVGMITNVNSSNYQADFPNTFSTVTLEYNDVTKAWTDNVHVGTNVTVNFLDLTSSIQIQQVLQNIYDLHLFTADGENTIAKKENILQGFISFVQQYNFLILQDLNNLKEIPQSSIINGALRALTVEDSYDSNATYFYQRTSGAQAGTFGIATGLTEANFQTNIQDSSITYYTYKDNVDDYIKYLDFTLYNPNYRYIDFYGQFKAIANSILEDIANAVRNTFRICQDQLETIDAAINWLKTQQVDWHTTTDPESAEWENATIWDDGTFKYKYKEGNGSLTCFAGESGASTEPLSVKDYNNLIVDVQEGIDTAALTHKGADHTLYGYKYVKVGSNIQFDKNYTSLNPYTEVTQSLNTSQASGTFRITINNRTYEVPIKGFGNISDEPIYIETEKIEHDENNNPISTPGTINFYGNMNGSGSIVTNNGNIYASSGAVAAGTYLAVRGYPSNQDRGELIGQNKTAVIWYDGESDIIHITGLNNENEDLPDSRIKIDINGDLIVNGDSTLGRKDPIYIPVPVDTTYDENTTYYHQDGTTYEDISGLPTNNTDSDEDGYIDDVYTIEYLYPDTITLNGDTIIGSEEAPVDVIINGVKVFSKDDENNGAQASGNGSLYFLGIGGWTDTLSGALKITNAGDGITGTTVDLNTGKTILPNEEFSGNTSASIYTQGGIYAVKNIYSERVFNAVFNDYAEYRTTIDAEAGRIVVDNDDGSLSLSSKRLQPGAQVISDTFGHAMGATDKCQTPLAVAGRALVYTYKDRNEYHAGMAVCSAPNGTVDIMTREEIREYPDCIIGIVSEIPDYEVWGSNNVKVNSRIWIKVR